MNATGRPIVAGFLALAMSMVLAAAVEADPLADAIAA